MALDAAALEACFQRLERPLYNVLYRWLWNASECQDVMQEAFLKVWARRAQVDIASLDALIYTSALNLARNRLRWHSLWREIEPDELAPDTGETPEAFAARSATQRLVREALDTLDPAARNLVLLAEFAGLSTQELATVLSIPAGTVGSRKHHAMARLRSALGERAHE